MAKLRVFFKDEVVKIRFCGTESHGFPNGTLVRVLGDQTDPYNLKCEYLDGHDNWFVKPSEIIKQSHLFKAKEHR